MAIRKTKPTSPGRRFGTYQVRATNIERSLVYPFYVIPAEEM